MTPILDPRRSDQVLADLLRRRAGYVPTFAPAAGGPGLALLRIASGEMAALVERLDQAPDKLGLALLDLIGVGLVPAQPARAPVVFSPTPGVGDATAPAGTRLGARVPGRESPLVFETESTIAISGAQLAEITSVDPGRDAYAAHAADLGAGRHVTLFAGATPFAHELYLGHATAFAFAGRVDGRDRPDAAARRLPGAAARRRVVGRHGLAGVRAVRRPGRRRGLPRRHRRPPTRRRRAPHHRLLPLEADRDPRRHDPLGAARGDRAAVARPAGDAAARRSARGALDHRAPAGPAVRHHRSDRPSRPGLDAPRRRRWRTARR